MSELKPTCCGRISLGAFYGSKMCGKTAKFERDGKHYCGTHDPVTIAEKNAIKRTAWNAELAAKDAARDEAKAKQAELERRADCYPELLEALKASANYIDILGGVSKDYRALIAKAEGKQA